MAKLKKLCAIVLVIVLAFSVTPDSVFAAKKAKISKTKATIYVGKTNKLKVKNNKKKVKWSTSNKKVAKVSKKGKVKGIKAGKATITAKVGKKAYKCKIKVKKKRNKKSNIKKPVIKPAESETTVEPTTKTEETTTPEVTEAASYNTDSSLEVTDGNKVNIDYVGKIDGVAFDGGSTDGKGTDHYNLQREQKTIRIPQNHKRTA